MNYSEKLRDPRWQKKRLEILERDGFACRMCHDTTTELHVHHTFYKNGLSPWSYPSESLITYCKECHQIVEDLKTANIQFPLLIVIYDKMAYAVFHHHKGKVKISMVKYVVKNQMQEIISLSEYSLTGLLNLINDAKKLIPNGERSNTPAVL